MVASSSFAVALVAEVALTAVAADAAWEDADSYGRPAAAAGRPSWESSRTVLVVLEEEEVLVTNTAVAAWSNQ